jgi:predicted DNA-binding transcriptional regulator YafY
VATLDRLERLTDLVLVLLHTSSPLTLDEIAREVPGYPEGHDARRQAFERDKRLLREDGVPVVTEPVEGPEQYGYRIDAGAFYLPDLELLPDEQAALHLAVAGVQLGDPSGRDALLKLGASGLAEARPVAALVPSEALVPLYDAMRVHADVGFRYRGATRSVAPAGLWFREGRWYLVGWDRDRQAARTFRVDRVEDVPRVGPPGSGALPDGFEPSEAAPDEPWTVGEGADDDVLLAVDAIEAPRVVEEVGERAVEERWPDGTVLLRLGVTSADALRSWVLGLLDHAEVVGPPAARRAMVEWLTALAGEGTSGGAPSGAEPPTDTSLTREKASGARNVGAPESGESGTRQPRAPRNNAGDRLRRLLAIVGWLARVGRAPIAEVAARFGIPEDEVVRELQLAACCGLPPYSPDALLEIVVTEDEVEANLGPELARPRRLTAAEGFALAAAARTIQAVPGADQGGALARALAKLDAALGSHRELVVDLDDPSLLGAVRQATEDRARLEIEYHSASSDETTRRVVDPLRVVSLDGHWYLDAHCHRAGGMRRFRVDRLRSARVVGRQPDGTSTPAAAGDLGPDAFVPGPGSVPVRLALDPSAAWVTDTVPVLDVRPGEEGGQVVTLALGGRAWLERLLLGLGPHARVLDPPELAGTAAAAARRVLRRYGPDTMKGHGET